MKTLRLFINENLNEAISWVLFDDDTATNQQGYSIFEEIYAFEVASVEVYLATSVCGIFKLNVADISDRKLSDGVILSKLEDQLIDDIEVLKPLLLRIDESTAYIAIFNIEFYETLMDKLSQLNKAIKFIQSIAFCVADNPDGWVICYTEHETFVRYSTYEYNILDDNEPIPLVLEKMLQDAPPKSILVYGDQYKDSLITELNAKFPEVEVKISQQDFSYGVAIWNFYNQKNSKFNLKLNKESKGALTLFIRLFKYLVIIAVAIWLIQVLFLYSKISLMNAKIRSSIANIVSTTNIDLGVVQMINNKVLTLQHAQGNYGQSDMLPLLSSFLEVVSDIGTDNITRIAYSSQTLSIFVDSSFKAEEFTNYKNIFATENIDANLTSYANYKVNNPRDSSNTDDPANSQPDINRNTAWVISLTHSLNAFNMIGQ